MSTAWSEDRARDTILRDGSAIRIRPSRPADHLGLVAFLQGLAPESRRMRFAGTISDLASVARRWVDLPEAGGCSIVAEATTADRIVAQASYYRVEPETAEVAFVVADAWQGRGIATLLLEELAERARTAGISTFRAYVLAQNRQMLQVLRESGFPMRLHVEPGSIVVEFLTVLEGPARERFEHREHVAASAAVRALMHPRSIAIVGDLRHRGTIGGELLHNLRDSGFTGPVYPIDPRADWIQSLRAYKSIQGAPDPIDLAAIALDAGAAVDAARECADKGVKTLVVLSSGFAEIGEEGLNRQRALVDVCRRAGMRLVGPNCMGVVNLERSAPMNATTLPTAPRSGNVAFLSQSGALGIAIIEHANRLGVGLSAFVSIGNKADLSGNDFLHYWESDPATAVIALYLESLGNPRKFARIARRVGRRKPIVVVKSGRSAAGARATSSHTGALIGASDITVDALFGQAGVVRTDTLGEFFDVTSLLANQPLPAGRRVAIITNGGGLGILTADACDADGLIVPPLPDEIRDALADFLPLGAALNNPIDTIDGSPDSFERAIHIVGGWEGIDAIIALFVPSLVAGTEEVATAIVASARRLPRPVTVVSVLMSPEAASLALRSGPNRVPAYDYPEDAVRALARAVRYAEWLAAPIGRIPEFDDLREDEAAATLAAALAPFSAETSTSDTAPPGAPLGRDAAGRWLRPDQTARLLDCYGIPTASWRLVGTPAEARRAAGEIGGRVALKALAPSAMNTAEPLAVVTSLRGPLAVEREARQMAAAASAIGQEVGGYLVQGATPVGLELLVGVVHDRLFGPVIACGRASEQEFTQDFAVRITPLSDQDAREMVRSLKTQRLADPANAQRADVAALESILLRVSAMVEAHPEIVELDLGPLMALQQGAVVIDAKVRIETPRDHSFLRSGI